MPNRATIKQILQDRKLAPSKKLGQNFLVHRHTADTIAELAVGENRATVVEVGVGLGSLTLPLAARVDTIIGLEVDSGIIRWHREQNDLPSNVTVLHQDILKADFAELARQCGGRLRIVANLPYSISNPLLFKLLAEQNHMESAVLMLQKEVAQRLTAAVGTKEYGVLTVLLGPCATMTALLDVGPAEFHPRPKVDSQVVRVQFQPPPPRAAGLPAYDNKLFTALVNGAFRQRRKTLTNALAATGLFPDKKAITGVLRNTGLAPAIRGERLGYEDFIRLTIEASKAGIAVEAKQ